MGTFYRAANWRSLGSTGGYAREPVPPVRWRSHGQPKEVLVYELEAGARAALSQEEEDPGWQGPAREAPPPAVQLRSLFDCLGEVEDYRCARGQRYPLRTVLTLAIAARLVGYRGVTAFAEFAALAEGASPDGRGGYETLEGRGQGLVGSADGGRDARAAAPAGRHRDGRPRCAGSLPADCPRTAHDGGGRQAWQWSGAGTGRGG